MNKNGVLVIIAAFFAILAALVVILGLLAILAIQTPEAGVASDEVWQDYLPVSTEMIYFPPHALNGSPLECETIKTGLFDRCGLACIKTDDRLNCFTWIFEE